MTARLVRLLEQRGHDAEEICRAIGIERDDVAAPSARVPYPLADALVEACARVFGAAGLALSLAPIVEPDTYDVAGLVLISSPTFGEGLARAFAYQRLWADGERFVLARDEAGATLRFRHPGKSPIARAVLAELAFVETIGACRLLVDPAAGAASVTFAHAPFTGSTALTAALGVEPVFGASENVIGFDAAVLEAPIRVPAAAIAAAHENLARRALAELPRTASLATRIRGLADADPSFFARRVGEIASRLHRSARTLQRELHAEGTSWAELLDEMRRTRAALLRRRGAGEQEIAFVIGFSDPTALARARARWAKRGGRS